MMTKMQLKFRTSEHSNACDHKPDGLDGVVGGIVSAGTLVGVHIHCTNDAIPLRASQRGLQVV